MGMGILGPVLLAASAAAAPPEPPQFAGLYRISQMEMAGGLELQPDGRFRYAFDYGAVSEESEGTWAVRDGTVLLTTDPMPPPAECDRGFASACFRDTPLTADDKNLILWRWDARIVLKPVQPRPR
jgi:hypothetical protein